MLVRPSDQIQASIASRVEGAKQDGTLALGDPQIDAQKLASKEQLALFYGQTPETEVTAWVVYAAQFAVAAGAVVAAAMLKGAQLCVQHALHTQNADTSGLDINQLLDIRQAALHA